MPVPIIAPTPRAIRCGQPKVGFRWRPPSAGAPNSIDFLRVMKLMGVPLLRPNICPEPRRTAKPCPQTLGARADIGQLGRLFGERPSMRSVILAFALLLLAGPAFADDA